MKILHVNAAYWPFPGGAEAYAQEISERLVRDGNEVTVLTTDAGSVEHFWARGKRSLEKSREIHNGVEIHRCRVAHLPLAPYSFYILRRGAIELSHLPLDTTPLLRFLAGFMPWVPDLARTLESLGPSFDLVHGMNISLEYPLIEALRFARRHHLPFVATPFLHTGEPHDDHVRRYYTMRHQIEALKASDLVIVQTEIEGDLISSVGVSPQRIRKVGLGVEPSRVQRGSEERFRERHNISGPIVAFIGTVTYDKGAIHLVEAMSRLWAEGNPATLVFIGSVVHEFNTYYARVSDEVRRRTRVLGVVTEEEKRDLLAASSLVVLSSRVDSFGIVYLEAWANKKPVIGARAGGVPEVVTDGEDGLLVPFGDIQGLSEAISLLLEDDNLASRLGEKGFRKTMRLYTWDAIYRKVKGIYEELVSQSPSDS